MHAATRAHGQFTPGSSSCSAARQGIRPAAVRTAGYAVCSAVPSGSRPARCSTCSRCLRPSRPCGRSAQGSACPQRPAHTAANRPSAPNADGAWLEPDSLCRMSQRKLRRPSSVCTPRTDLHDVGAVQAVDAVGAEDAALAGGVPAAALCVEAPPLEVALHLAPQLLQTAHTATVYLCLRDCLDDVRM